MSTLCIPAARIIPRLRLTDYHIRQVMGPRRKSCGTQPNTFARPKVPLVAFLATPTFSGLGLPAIGIVFVMMGILVILGTFMEWIAIAFITVPVFAPVVVGMAPELGLEPEWAAVWFGVLFVMNIQIYFLSPPFGPACFWLKSVAPADITLQEIFLSVLLHGNIQTEIDDEIEKSI